MKEYAIRLNDIQKVYKFSRDMEQMPFDVDLISEDRRHIVNAKSAMGIFSLDLSGQLTLRAYVDTPEDNEMLRTAVLAY